MLSGFSKFAYLSFINQLKYRGPILRVTSPALGSDNLTLDQSAMGIQILPEPVLVTWHVFHNITTLTLDQVMLIE